MKRCRRDYQFFACMLPFLSSLRNNKNWVYFYKIRPPCPSKIERKLNIHLQIFCKKGKKISLICQFSMKNRPCGTIPSYGTVNSNVNYCQNTIRNEEVISHQFLYVCSPLPCGLSSLFRRIETKVLVTQEE